MLFGDSDENEIYLEGISFVLIGEPFRNGDGSTEQMARLTEDTTNYSLDLLAGKGLNGKLISGIRRFGTDHQPAGREIGIVFKE